MCRLNLGYKFRCYWDFIWHTHTHSLARSLARMHANQWHFAKSHVIGLISFQLVESWTAFVCVRFCIVVVVVVAFVALCSFFAFFHFAVCKRGACARVRVMSWDFICKRRIQIQYNVWDISSIFFSLLKTNSEKKWNTIINRITFWIRNKSHTPMQTSVDWRQKKDESNFNNATYIFFIVAIIMPRECVIAWVGLRSHSNHVLKSC